MLLALFILTIAFSFYEYKTLQVARDQLKENTYSSEPDMWVTEFLLCLIIVATLVLMIWMFAVDGSDKKLTYYEKQNVELERKIDVSVKNYLNTDSEVYKNFKKGDGMALIANYPKLSKSGLIRDQIDMYKDNAKEIKKLKGRSIRYNTIKWWIYFGGK